MVQVGLADQHRQATAAHLAHDLRESPRRLTGEFIPIKEPYHFLIESEVMLNWGEKLTKADKQRLGIAELLNH